ncbi:MAG: hypothetical protein H7222_15900 [Methylotenera sp.]|nr:hypothetical protein [Oligoflexia bacterium]
MAFTLSLNSCGPSTSQLAEKLGTDIDPSPQVTSIKLTSPAHTSATTAEYEVVFSAPVTGVDVTDFALSTTGIMDARISKVTGSGTTYTVTVFTGTQDGTVKLNLIDNNSIKSLSGFTLVGKTSTSGNFSTAQAVIVDRTPPVITISPPTPASVNHTGTAVFQITYEAGSVINLNASNILRPSTGVACQAAVTTDPLDAMKRLVTVSNCTGNGTVGLQLPAGSATDAVGNLAETPASNTPLSVSNIDPVIVSILRSDTLNPTNTALVHFRVRMSKPVKGVDPTDFTVFKDASIDSSATVASVTPDSPDANGYATSYTVTVRTGTSGNGTLRLDLIDNDTIRDQAGNPLGSIGLNNGNFVTGDSYTVDRTFPVVTSFKLFPALSAPRTSTNASSLVFKVVFSRAVSFVDASSFAPVTTGLSGNTFTIAEDPAAVPLKSAYLLTVQTGTGDGTLKINLNDTNTITDGLNALGGSVQGDGNASSDTITIDKTPPSISFSNPDQQIINASQVASWGVSYSGTETITLIPADIKLTFTGTATCPDANIVISGTGSAARSVSISGCSGEGTATISVKNVGTAVDNAGNLATIAGPSPSVTVSGIKPSVVSITRKDADPTNSVNVDFNVTFSKSVTGFILSNLQVIGTGLSSTSVLSITGSGTTYVVRVKTGVDGTIGLQLNSNNTIQDASGNTLSGSTTNTYNSSTSPLGEIYHFDKTAPYVVSINRVESEFTKLGTLHFLVQFSEPVSGLAAGDFAAIAYDGASATSTVSLTAGGALPTATYTVTVTGVSGNGHLRLNLTDNGNVKDIVNDLVAQNGAADGSFTTGQIYTIDTVAPAPVISTPSVATINSDQSSTFVVTYTEDVTLALTPAKVIITPSGAGIGCTGVAIGTTATPLRTANVTLSNCTGDGSVQISLAAGSATDLAGNSALASAQSPVLNVVGKAPWLTSINRVNANPTMATSLHFTLTFSEPVSGLALSDLVATKVSGTLGGLSVTSFTPASGPSATYDVLLNAGTGSGQLRLDLVDSGTTQIKDFDLNLVRGSSPGYVVNGSYAVGQAYDIDRTPPAVISMTKMDPEPSPLSVVRYAVTFSEAVTNVNLSDFSVTEGGVTGTSVTAIAAQSSSVYTVSVNTGSGNGTLQLQLKAANGITDTLGNAMTTGFSTAPAYIIDKTPPTVVSVTRSLAQPTKARYLTFAVSFSRPVSGVDVSDFVLSKTGNTISSIVSSVSPASAVLVKNYVVTVDTGTTDVGDGTIGLNVKDDDSINDSVNPLYGPGTSASAFTGDVYTVDRSAPTIAISIPSPANVNRLQTSVFTLTYTGVDTASDITLVGANVTVVPGAGGSTCTGVTVAGSGTTTRTVTLSNCRGDGLVGITLAAGTAKDTAGNLAAAASSGATLALVAKAPYVLSMVRESTNPTNGSTALAYLVTFSEAVTGVQTSSFQANASGVTASLSVAVVSASAYRVSLTVTSATGSGTLGLRLTDQGANQNLILDTDLNPLMASDGITEDGTTDALAYTVDRTPPSVVSINRVGGQYSSATTVQYVVTFSEPVTGIMSTDFSPAVASGTITGASVSASITPPGPAASTTYTVTVNTPGVNDSGNLRLDLANSGSTGITDSVGNLLPVGSFSTGQFFTIDKMKPTASVIARNMANPTNLAQVGYTVTFTEAVQNVTAASFAVLNSNGAGASVASVSQIDSSHYSVLVGSGATDGIFSLKFSASSAITDLAGNALDASTFPVTSYTLQLVPLSIAGVNFAYGKQGDFQTLAIAGNGFYSGMAGAVGSAVCSAVRVVSLTSAQCDFTSPTSSAEKIKALSLVLTNPLGQSTNAFPNAFFNLALPKSWLAADKIPAGMIVSNKVTKWPDFAGNSPGGDATPPAANLAPTYVPTGPGSRAAVEFDPNALTAMAIPNGLLDNPSARLAIFAVVTDASTASDHSFRQAVASDNYSLNLGRVYDGTSGNIWTLGSLGAATAASPHVVSPGTTTQLLTFQYGTTTNTLTLKLNGVAQPTQSVASQDLSSKLWLGRRGGNVGSEYWKGTISEVIIYQDLNSLDPAQVGVIETYLKAKYNLP